MNNDVKYNGNDFEVMPLAATPSPLCGTPPPIEGEIGGKKLKVYKLSNTIWWAHYSLLEAIEDCRKKQRHYPVDVEKACMLSEADLESEHLTEWEKEKGMWIGELLTFKEKLAMIKKPGLFAVDMETI